MGSYIHHNVHLFKPEPNMLKTLIYQLFLLALLKKFTYYSYFILISLPIIPILSSFCFTILCIDI